MSARDGRATIVIADQVHEPSAARQISLAFPINGEGEFSKREAHIAKEALKLLTLASEALLKS